MSAETDEYKKRIGVPEAHTLRFVEGKWRASKGQDADTDLYEQLDETGVVVAKWEVVDSTSIYPPFERSISHRRVE